MHGFGGAQFLRQFFQVVDDGRTGSDVAARNDFSGIGVRDDVAVAIYDEDSAFAHASIAYAFEEAVNRDHRRDHASKLAVQRERNRNDERRAIIFSEREGFTDKGQSLNAGGKGAFERATDERILVGAEAAGGLPFGELVDGGDVQNVLIIFDEALQQACELRCVRGVVHIFNPAGEGEDLALAEQLFAEILFELQSFAGEQTGDFGLLDALGVLQSFFAEAQDLAMVKASRCDAYEQQGTQHNPEDAQAAGRLLLEGFRGHRDLFAKIVAKWAMGYNGTMVLGLANKIQTDWGLWRVRRREFRGGERAGLRPAPTDPDFHRGNNYSRN